MVVPNYLPEGLSMLAGKPKIGKSWMALDMCLGVAGGERVLGKTPPVGDVLYLALEDTDRRLQRRMRKLLRGKPWSPRLTLVTKWRRLDTGGVEDIADWANSVHEPRLVVLDTLAGVRPERSKLETTYDGDYKALIELHQLANARSFAALTLHHTRKLEAEDPLDTVSGTLGTVGCVDTVLVLARSTKGTTLYLRGRDVEESEHAVTFNRETYRWEVLGNAETVHLSGARKKIIAVLQAVKPKSMGPNEIAAGTGVGLKAIEQRLRDMIKDGEVFREERGQYRIA
jgi:RecA-family ATPase